MSDLYKDKARQRRNPLNIFRRNWWYVITKVNGRLVVWGKFTSKDEADRKGFEKLRGVLFESVELPTSDLSDATRMAKARNLDTTSDIIGSIGRASHKEDIIKKDDNNNDPQL